jgi:hypothetical protein
MSRDRLANFDQKASSLFKQYLKKGREDIIGQSFDPNKIKRGHHEVKCMTY